jgi:uracil-DNA glycosylase family 4
MSSGFFAESLLVGTPKTELDNAHLRNAKCGACKMHQHCENPYMPVQGNGEKGILIVLNYPTHSDDLTGRPLTGKQGAFLADIFREFDIDLFKDCWVTFALTCSRSKKTPTNAQVENCRPNMLKVLAAKKPSAIILMGNYAVESVIGWTWKDGTGDFDRWVGWRIPDQSLNAWITPTYSVNEVLFEENETRKRLLEGAFVSHIADALSVSHKRPWSTIPNWAERVRPIMSDTEAAIEIKKIIRLNQPTAVDYEANGLKPEYDGFKILCCSLSVLGSRTAISFPWAGRSIKAMARFWTSRLPKVAANLKYEDRVTNWFFGKRVRNWHWDTMLAAHYLDCRGGITSIKFQVYVLLGVGAYNDHIAQFLASARGETLNNAEMDIDLRQLLIYCGEDSLYEGLVAQIQWGEFSNL